MEHHRPDMRIPIFNDESDEDKSNIPKTPKRKSFDHDIAGSTINDRMGLSPLTPTYNLKMLTRVASEELPLPETPTIPNCKRLKLADVFKDETNKISLRKRYIKLESKTPRGDRSLKQLCRRFLDKFPLKLEVCSATEICLNTEADLLQVGKRRIYDIIAVMEALTIATRKCKNRYIWRGDSTLVETLTHLKVLGQQKNIGKLVESISDGKMTPDGSSSLDQKEYYLTDCDNFKRSLMSLTQHFMIIFLSMQNPKFLTLEFAAKVMDFLGPSSECPSRPKTVIRRLYDVANILCSLDLVTKTLADTNQSEKPGFLYIGPNP